MPASRFYLGLCLSLGTVIVPSLAFADQAPRQRDSGYGFLYGFGLAVNQELYQGYSTRVIPLPVVGYRGEDLTIFGPIASYKLLQLADFNIKLRLQPRFAGYDEDDSPVFAGMAQRHYSMDGGFALDYKLGKWKTDFSTVFDLLGRSNGFESKASLGRPLQFGPIFIEPSVGVTYQSSKLVDYYYGVRANEATDSRPAYSAGAAVNYQASIGVMTPILFGGITRFQVSNTWYDNDLLNSPLTSGRKGLTFLLSYSRLFKF